MDEIKCPHCGAAGKLSIAPLRPMAAGAAQMLEYAVIFRCGSCAAYMPAAQVKCPKCEKSDLVTELKGDARGPSKTRTGFVKCPKCNWNVTIK